ncbi:MAG: multicopper oxidase domain-containing protein, partial [Bacteroidia bacterium]
GDFILVNGKTWPVLEVEPRKYRFRIVNGSDSRFYNLTLPDNVKFHHIGSDGGLLNAPVVLNNILIGPGERKDVIVDFSDPLLLTKTLILKNDAPTPFPEGDSVVAGLTDQIMAFKVTKALQGIDNSTIPQALRQTPIQALTNPKTTRQLLLAEDEDEHGGLISMLGTSALGQLEYEDPITENPKLHDVEMWEIINTTPDAHPIHLHLVTYQVVNRQKFDTETYEIGKPSSLKLIGNTMEPAPEDKGWKDTYVMYPGEVTRIIAKFDREGLYVWHCHILTHEDHEMMRPYYVGDIPISVPEKLAKENIGLNVDVYPNPFSGQINISFQLEKASPMEICIYNMLGEKIATVHNGQLQPGSHNLLWNGENADGNLVPAGVYLCRIKNGNTEKSFKLVKTK